MSAEALVPDEGHDRFNRDLQIQCEEALTRTFTNFRSYLFSYCVKIGVPESDVEDLLQEAWIIAHEHLHQLRDPKAIAAWVRRILWTRACNKHRRRREWTVAGDDSTHDDGEIWGHTSLEETPLEILLAEERARVLRASVTELREIDRTALDAFYLRGMTLKEAALEEGVPIGTMKRRLHMGRKRLLASMPAEFLDDA